MRRRQQSDAQVIDCDGTPEANERMSFRGEC